ncbi:hydantoin utilization protein A [uncultured Prochlorococcus sp.]|uniref:hydantoin utilization protein A n=1 Tax=uncultured Prochlorococcus sp. TaxID=159733 RepID=UPI002588C1A9|nr:hydantoin utilization protein A [uncultured Prochlorococcus sp.]
MQAVILTGIIAGFVHVISGADHLIAMAPAAINSPKKALKNSYSWGLGHSSGVLLLAFLAIFIKDITPLNKFSSIAEFFVGISLLIVGVIAIKNSFRLNMHSHSHKHENGFAHRHYHFHTKEQKHNKKHSHALTGLGLLHGIAGGSHFLAVLPALALPLTSACFYLISYLIGSLISMNLFTCFISFTTFNSGQKFIKRLISFAGGLSFCMGLFWIQKSSSIFLT